MKRRHDWFWGSHGCDLPEGHLGVCQCGEPDDPCSQYDTTHQMARYMTFEGSVPNPHPAIEEDWRQAGWSGWAPNPHGFSLGLDNTKERP